MSPFAIRMLIIFGITFFVTTLRFLFEGRTVSNKIAKPSKFQLFFLGVQTFITILMGLLALLGFAMKNTEMTIIFAIMTVIFGLILYGMRRKFKRYYEEDEDSFYLKEQYMVDRIYYENITDWIPLKKRIGVLDPTQDQEIYAVINFAFHDPEVLLTKLAEMTFAEKFEQEDEKMADDPYRKQEFVDHLKKNGYEHIVEPFLQNPERIKTMEEYKR